MKKLTSFLAVSSNPTAHATNYTKSFSYSRLGQAFRVYVRFDDDPTHIQFAVRRYGSDNSEEFAWAQKNSSCDLEILHNDVTIEHLPLPEWDEDMYEDIDEYYNQLFDIACIALDEANKICK